MPADPRNALVDAARRNDLAGLEAASAAGARETFRLDCQSPAYFLFKCIFQNACKNRR
jgi:hypothetical protein